MRLSNIAILALRGSKDIREKIKGVEKCSTDTVNRWVRNNDSSLTKAAIIDIIRKDTGLSDEQILDEVEEGELAK